MTKQIVTDKIKIDSDFLWSAGSFAEFRDKINEIWYDIPEEYRANATIEFESEFESSRIECEIIWQRWETDEEYNKRIRKVEIDEEILRVRKLNNDLYALQKLIADYPEQAKEFIAKC